MVPLPGLDQIENRSEKLHLAFHMAGRNQPFCLYVSQKAALDTEHPELESAIRYEMVILLVATYQAEPQH